MSKQIITQERLKELFSYDPETGTVTWKIKKHYQAKLGKEAGFIHRCKNGSYRRLSVDGKAILTHRAIWLYMYGVLPNGEIDHIDGNGMNNKLSNLRDVSKELNQRNSKLRKDNKNGIQGVLYFKPTRKYHATIFADKKRIYLGVHDDFLSACCARKSAEIRYGFHENHGRR